MNAVFYKIQYFTSHYSDTILHAAFMIYCSFLYPCQAVVVKRFHGDMLGLKLNTRIHYECLDVTVITNYQL